MNSSGYLFRGLFYRETGFHGRTPRDPFVLPWSQESFERLFPLRLEADKHHTPMWAAVSLKAGMTRSEDAILEIYAVVLDKDCGDLGELDACRKHLLLSGTAFALHTGYSHANPKKVHDDTGLTGPFDSFRVVLPLSRPVPANEFRSLVAAVMQTGIVPPDPEKYSLEVAGKTVKTGDTERPARPRGWDPAAYKPAQPWFVPSCPQEHENDALLEVYEGSVLDVDKLLSYKLLPTNARRYYTHEPPSDEARANFKKLAEALEDAGFPLGDDDPTSNCRAVCPSCKDASPSLVVTTKGERVLVCCHAQCDVKSILKAIGLNVGNLQTVKLQEAQHAKHMMESHQFLQAVKRESIIATNESEEAIQRAFGNDRVTPYTIAELDAMAPTNKRWILHTPAGYFLRSPRGYIPVMKDAVLVKARDVLAPAVTANVFLTEADKEGNQRPKPLSLAMEQYGQAATEMGYSYCVRQSELLGDVFLQAAGQPIPFSPEYNAAIDMWLKLFSGDQYETLLDWLATLLDLSRPTSAVCIVGVPGAGKDMFIEGLAALWGGHKISFDRALGNFNDRLKYSPLVVANEQVKTPPFFSGNAIDALKEMITDGRRDIEAKFAHPVPLFGCLRVILAANKSGSLKFDKSSTHSDIAALDERILLLRSGDECKQYLVDIGGRPATEAWVSGGGLARHVMWLKENRSVVTGSRFLVQGKGGMSDILAADGKSTSIILRAILSALLGPMQRDEKVACARKGQVLFHPKNLRFSWTQNQWAGKAELPDDYGDAVDVISERGAGKTVKVGGEALKMRTVLLPVIERAAATEGRQDELEAIIAASKE